MADSSLDEIKQQARQQAVKDFMAKQGQVQQGQGGPAGPLPINPMVQMADQAALPTGLGHAGGLLGGGLTTGMGMGLIPGAVAGESLGSMAGTGINMLTGIQEPSLKDLMLSGAAPPAMRGMIGAVKKGVSMLPGAAVELQSLGAKFAKQMAGKSIEPSGTSQELFQMLKQLGEDGAQAGRGPVLVRADNLKRAAQEIIDAEGGLPVEGSRDAGVLKLAEEVKRLADTSPAGLDLSSVAAQSSRFGRDSGFDATRPAAISKANAKLHAAMIQDLELAAQSGTTPEAHVLRAATQASKLEKTRDELANYIEQKVIQPQATTGLEYVNAKGLVQHLKSDKRIRGLPQDQQDDLMATAKMLLKIPALPPPGNYGSGRVVGRAGLAGAAALGLGAEPATASIVSGIAAGAPQVIGYAMTSTPGRAMLRAMLQSNQGTLTHHNLAILGSFMQATQAQPGSRMTQ